MNLKIKLPICVGVLTLISSLGLLRATTPIVYPPDSGMIDVTKSPYTADPTGTIDATSTIQAAILANCGGKGVTHTLYFPQGTYKISKTLNCLSGANAGKPEHRMSFQGAGKGLTILKLIDNDTVTQTNYDGTVASFQDPAHPAGVIHLNNVWGNSPNDGFQNNVWDMTIDVGKGNPGAIGIDWCACNLATIRNVSVVSSDPNYAGYSGIYCDGWPGPCLIKNVDVTGFTNGIFVRSNQLGVTIDTVTLTHQTGYGIYNNGNGVFMHKITSTNAVPALYADSPGNNGLNVMDNCVLTGSSSTVPAITAQTVTTPLYLRHITTSGYSALVASGANVLQLASIPNGEFSMQQTQRLFNNSEAGLMLDPTGPDAPEYYDPNLAPSHWANVITFGADPTGNSDSTAAIQAAMNSGATTVYFPLVPTTSGTLTTCVGTYRITGPINVGGSVVRIFGNQAVLKTSYDATGTISHPGAIFNIQNGTNPYVILDRITIQDAGGIYNVINQATTRQVVVRDSALGGYGNTVTGGSLYLENNEALFGTFDHMTVYAWQLDGEQAFPKIVNKASTFWVLGLKTENATTAVQTLSGGKTEVIGGFMFSNSATWNTPIFLNQSGSQFFGSFEQFNSGSLAGDFADLIRENQGGISKDLRSWDSLPFGSVTRYSNNSAAPSHAVPTATITSPTDGQVFTAPANIPVTYSSAAGTGTLTGSMVEAVLPFEVQNTPNNIGTAPSFTWNSVAAGNYTLYAKVTDNGGVTGYSAPIHIIVKPSLTTTGLVSREYWEANGQQWVPESFSGLVSQLEIFPNFLNDKPDFLTYLTSASTTTPGRNQGIRIHGYIQPTTTGTYTFNISSSASSALWLSGDSNVGNKQLIALNDGTLTPGGTFAVNSWRTDNSSANIPLTAGSKYYFEAVQAYCDGNTPVNPVPAHVEVAWTGPGITQQVIPGANLLPFDPTVSEAQAAPPAGTIYPEADAWVRGGGTSGVNYGNEPVLYVSTSDYPGVTVGTKNYIPGGLLQTFSRYDLSGLSGSVTHATLWMYVQSTQTGDSDQLETALLPGGDTYTESGLTQANSPALNAGSVAGPWTPVAGEWVQQDVTALVQAAYANDPNKKFTFGIVHTGTLTKTMTSYSSKEDVQPLWPHLVVTTTGGTHTPFVTGQTLGTVASGHVGGGGFQFTVGSSPITVYSLGRWVLSGNTGTHALTLVQASNNAVLGTVTVATSGAPAGAYVYGNLTTPIVLTANTSYYVQSAETSPGDSYYNQNTTLTTTSAGTITNAENSASGNRWFTGTLGSFSYGPVNFTYGP